MPLAERPAIDPATIAARDAALRERLAEALAAGARVRFFMQSSRQQALVESIAPDGALSVAAGALRLPMPLSRLTLAERRSLAAAVRRPGVAADEALVEFYRLAAELETR